MDQLIEKKIRKREELAKAILQLDQKRDELYEELISLTGNKTHEFLRKAQNGR